MEVNFEKKYLPSEKIDYLINNGTIDFEIRLRLADNEISDYILIEEYTHSKIIRQIICVVTNIQHNNRSLNNSKDRDYFTVLTLMKLNNVKNKQN